MAEYRHPHTSVRVTDQSQYFLVGSGVTTLYQAFTSAYGPDNELVDITSGSEFLFKFGALNFAKYGQAQQNMYNWVNGPGIGLGVRVLPEDASYANIVMLAKYKENPAYAGDNTQPRWIYRTEWVSFTNENIADGTINFTPTDTDNGLVTKKTSLDVALSSPNLFTDPDTDMNIVPLMAFRVRGRGDGGYYNNFSVKITPSSQSADYPDFRVYSVEVYQGGSGGLNGDIQGPFLVALDPEAVDISGESMHISHILGSYSDYLEIHFDADNFSNLGDTLFADNGGAPMFDFIGLSDRKDENGVYLNEYTDFVELTKNRTDLYADPPNEQGMDDYEYAYPLLGGQEGDFTNMNAAQRRAVFDSLKEQAYLGTLPGTDQILDKKTITIDMLLDANETTQVKSAMNKLASVLRQDCMCILDTGLTASAQDALDKRQNEIGFSNYYTAIFAQDITITDSSTQKDIKVTTPYLLASLIPSNDSVHGVQIPFVGPRRGVIGGFKSISWVPTTPIWKEDLYNSQINYIERDAGRYKLATQQTSQAVTSSLSDINHIRSLFLIRRGVEAVVENYKQEPNVGGSLLGAANAELNNWLSRWVINGTCSDIGATVYASEYDQRQKIMRVSVTMSFTDVLTRIFINLIIN